jgi:hypothetical protein
MTSGRNVSQGSAVSSVVTKSGAEGRTQAGASDLQSEMPSMDLDLGTAANFVVFLIHSRAMGNNTPKSSPSKSFPTHQLRTLPPRSTPYHVHSFCGRLPLQFATPLPSPGHHTKSNGNHLQAQCQTHSWVCQDAQYAANGKATPYRPGQTPGGSTRLSLPELLGSRHMKVVLFLVLTSGRG